MNFIQNIQQGSPVGTSMCNGGGGGKGGEAPPPAPPAAPPPSAPAPMKNPSDTTNNTQSDSMASREGTRSLRIDLGGTNSSTSGLNIPT